MKSICFSFLAVLFTSLSSFAQEDAITKYFNKYMDDEKFSVVYISPKMFSMVSKIEIEDMEPELQEVIKSMKGLRILHTEQNALQYYNDALKTINKMCIRDRCYCLSSWRKWTSISSALAPGAVSAYAIWLISFAARSIGTSGKKWSRI